MIDNWDRQGYVLLYSPSNVLKIIIYSLFYKEKIECSNCIFWLAFTDDVFILCLYFASEVYCKYMTPLRLMFMTHPALIVSKVILYKSAKISKDNEGISVFNHLNGRLDLVRLCLFRRLRFRWLNWNSLKVGQGKAAQNQIVN